MSCSIFKNVKSQPSRTFYSYYENNKKKRTIINNNNNSIIDILITGIFNGKLLMLSEFLNKETINLLSSFMNYRDKDIESKKVIFEMDEIKNLDDRTNLTEEEIKEFDECFIFPEIFFDSSSILSLNLPADILEIDILPFQVDFDDLFEEFDNIRVGIKQTLGRVGRIKQKKDNTFTFTKGVIKWLHYDLCFQFWGYAAIQRFINEITTSNNIDKLNDPQLMTEEDIEKLKSLKTTIEDLDLSNEICFLEDIH